MLSVWPGRLAPFSSKRKCTAYIRKSGGWVESLWLRSWGGRGVLESGRDILEHIVPFGILMRAVTTFYLPVALRSGDYTERSALGDLGQVSPFRDQDCTKREKGHTPQSNLSVALPAGHSNGETLSSWCRSVDTLHIQQGSPLWRTSQPFHLDAPSISLRKKSHYVPTISKRRTQGLGLP